jgi:5-methyltetrahydropteroyltriglutamate--homocysteine methyltransferase
VEKDLAPVGRHPYAPDVSFDGGNMDCGNGLLLLIRRHIDPLPPGGLLEIRSTEASVEEDLPAWCRLTSNEMVSWTRNGEQRSYLVSKGKFTPRAATSGVTAAADAAAQPFAFQPAVAITIPASLPVPAPAPTIAPLSVMGIGSWPRPRWMVQAIHDHMEQRLSEADYQATADDAVRLAMEAQLRAGVDVVTDGEQRRDNYASFVGGLLDNCVLVPLTDLLPLVDDPEHFEREMKSLDVPADKVRHPAVFGPLGRSRPLAVHELEFARGLTQKPVKVALPGPYLLTRTMWMECLAPHAYESREKLSDDIVRVLREELHYLLAAGAALVQFDEPVLSEVVFTAGPGGHATRSFMCGALSEKKDPATELAFARSLINRVVEGLPRERVALHMCRGNWTPDESAALAGNYEPLVEMLGSLNVGTLFLELCTPRAGEMDVLRSLARSMRIGVGVVNQKHPRIETVDEIVARGREAIRLFGAERVLLTPDCGFATFADNPVSSAAIAEQKLRAIAQASAILRQG